MDVRLEDENGSIASYESFYDDDLPWADCGDFVYYAIGCNYVTGCLGLCSADDVLPEDGMDDSSTVDVLQHVKQLKQKYATWESSRRPSDKRRGRQLGHVDTNRMKRQQDLYRRDSPTKRHQKPCRDLPTATQHSLQITDTVSNMTARTFLDKRSGLQLDHVDANQMQQRKVLHIKGSSVKKRQKPSLDPPVSSCHEIKPPNGGQKWVNADSHAVTNSAQKKQTVHRSGQPTKRRNPGPKGLRADSHVDTNSMQKKQSLHRRGPPTKRRKKQDDKEQNEIIGVVVGRQPLSSSKGVSNKEQRTRSGPRRKQKMVDTSKTSVCPKSPGRRARRTDDQYEKSVRMSRSKRKHRIISPMRNHLKEEARPSDTRHGIRKTASGESSQSVLLSPVSRRRRPRNDDGNRTIEDGESALKNQPPTNAAVKQLSDPIVEDPDAEGDAKDCNQASLSLKNQQIAGSTMQQDGTFEEVPSTSHKEDDVEHAAIVKLRLLKTRKPATQETPEKSLSGFEVADRESHGGIIANEVLGARSVDQISSCYIDQPVEVVLNHESCTGVEIEFRGEILFPPPADCAAVRCEEPDVKVNNCVIEPITNDDPDVRGETDETKREEANEQKTQDKPHEAPDTTGEPVSTGAREEGESVSSPEARKQHIVLYALKKAAPSKKVRRIASKIIGGLRLLGRRGNIVTKSKESHDVTDDSSMEQSTSSFPIVHINYVESST